MKKIKFLILSVLTIGFSGFAHEETGINNLYSIISCGKQTFKARYAYRYIRKSEKKPWKIQPIEFSLSNVGYGHYSKSIINLKESNNTNISVTTQASHAGADVEHGDVSIYPNIDNHSHKQILDIDLNYNELDCPHVWQIKYDNATKDYSMNACASK